MERQKAVIASAMLAGSLMTGGLVFAVNGGALDARQDNVGKLQPTVTQAVAPASYVDPTTTSSTVAPTTTKPAAPVVVASAPRTVTASTTSKASPTASSGEHDDDEGYESGSDGDDD